jgi:two-component system, OmpR family, sensor kinase
MARHFLQLFALIVLTLAAASWGQDWVLQSYGGQESSDDHFFAIAAATLADDLRREAPADWPEHVARLARAGHVDMELFSTSEIAGGETLASLRHGRTAYMRASGGDSWALRQVDGEHVLAVRAKEPRAQRSPLEWTLTLLFYAAIALVVMTWLWPLTRDLRVLENAVRQFGDRNWSYSASIPERSQVRALAETFRRMAARIDGLITSHKEMSNAVSHEIKTPLARMRFELELAEHSEQLEEARRHCSNIREDIAAIDALVNATLEYAILERAGFALNLGVHNFARLIPALAEQAKRTARSGVEIALNVTSDAERVVCDAHLLESVLKNLFYNAARYATREVRISFRVQDGLNQLLVEDDGPGIPQKDRERIFESFVQLDQPGGQKGAFGLGLAIVRRAIEWHGGQVAVSESSLGGACFRVTWPRRAAG